MNTNIKSILIQFKHGHVSLVDAELEILSLLDENGVGVSDSSAKHGDLPHVRKSECEAKETDESIGESEQITLGNRIDDENKCRKCGKVIGVKNFDVCGDCYEYFPDVC